MCGGVTLGHVMPLLAVAENLSLENWRIDFMSTNIGFEKKLILKNGYKYISVVGSRSSERFSFINLQTSFFLLMAIFSTICKFASNRPILVIGTGSFASVPAYVSAVIFRIPLYIIEPNAKPGLVNIFFIPFCHTSYRFIISSKPHISNKNLGLPLRKEFLVHCPTNVLQKNYLLKNLLFVGGSLGSCEINSMVVHLMKEGFLSDYEITLICGKEDYPSLISLRTKNIIVFPYVDDIGLLYQKADIIISSSGANTIAEVVSMRKPLILVPSSKSTGGHQILNSEFLLDNYGIPVVNLMEKDWIKKFMGYINQAKDFSIDRTTLLSQNLACSAGAISADIVEPWCCAVLNTQLAVYKKISRLFDIITALILLIPLTFFCIFVCIAMKICKPRWPLIFRQIRTGRYSKRFWIYKFTTLPPDFPEVPTRDIVNFTIDNTSWIHKFIRQKRINEIPQLINIILGDMSFVGPRPVIDADREIIKLRQGTQLVLIRPGVTFIDRIKNGEELSISERVKLELSYLTEKDFLPCFFQDMKIILHSFLFMLK